MMKKKETSYFSHVLSKPAVLVCKNKGPDKLGGNCAADQLLRFCHNTSTS